jgi:hypothetical protein
MTDSPLGGGSARTEVRQHPTPAARQLLHDAFEGKRDWGTLDEPHPANVRARAWGFRRITVYPPGTNAAERRALTFHLRWPGWGLLAALGIEILIGTTLEPVVGLLIACLVYASGLAVGLVLTNGLRQRVRRVSMVAYSIAGGIEEHGQPELFRLTRSRFAQLDHSRALGELTPAQYELGWAEAYDALA